MKAEIISVGTELLLGQIVNTNAAFLSCELADLGVDVYFQTVVGDNPTRLHDALAIAAARADMIICTGGLGPTQDDLTKDVVARFLGRRLVTYQPAYEMIEKYLRDRGLPMTENQARQAYIIEGGDALDNPTGMAIGTALSAENKHYLLLPGPPREMEPMFLESAKPWIRALPGQQAPLFSKMLKFAGIGEAAVEEALLDLIDTQDRVTIAPYAKEGEVSIRLTVRAESRSAAESMFTYIMKAVYERLGSYLYAEQDIPLEEAVLASLRKYGLQLAAAESLTGGLLSELLTCLPGSSQHFAGGLVAYTNQMKHALLHVDQNTLNRYGAVSGETARAMAENVLRLADSDIAVSLTGIAGPDAVENKPVGLTYIGLARKGHDTEVHAAQFRGNREVIRLRAAKRALYEVWRVLERNGQK